MHNMHIDVMDESFSVHRVLIRQKKLGYGHVERLELPSLCAVKDLLLFSLCFLFQGIDEVSQFY
jgi:hypothetical protein